MNVKNLIKKSSWIQFLKTSVFRFDFKLEIEITKTIVSKQLIKQSLKYY